MKKLRFMGSKKFWMVLSAILCAFVLALTLSLLLIRPEQKVTYVVYPQTQVTTEQSQGNNVDHSFDAVQDRVNSANDNYGSEIKSAYSGETSTMEKMMQQRMIFSAIRSVLLYGLLVLVILLILIKGFNLRLFKKKLIEEAPETPEKVKPVAPKKPIKEAPAEQVGKPKSNPTQEEKKSDEKKEEQTEVVKKAPDEEEIESGCQLP